jgi:hypothetical protein
VAPRWETPNRFTVYRTCPLATPEDRLFFLLTYLKTYAVQVVPGAAVRHEPEQSQPVDPCPAAGVARGAARPRRCPRPLPHGSGWLSRRGHSRRWRSLRPPQPPHPELGRAPPLYGAFDVKRFPSRFSDIVHPYVRSKGPSLRPDHERGRTRGWVEVKDGPQGHRRRRRPASLRFAHPRATLGWLMTGQLGGSAVPRRSSRVRALDPTTLYSVRHAAGDASCASDARLPGGWDHSFARLEAHGGTAVHHPPRKASGLTGRPCFEVSGVLSETEDQTALRTTPSGITPAVA